MKKYFALLLIYLLPAVGCAYWSIGNNLAQLGWGILAALAAVILVMAINFLGKIPAALVAVIYWLLSVLEWVSFFVTGGSFDGRFLYHFNYNAIRYAPGNLQLATILGILLILAGVVAILVIIFRFRSKVTAKMQLALVFWLGGISGMAFLLIAPSPLSGAMRLVALTKSSSRSELQAPEGYRDFGLKDCTFDRNEVMAAPGKNLVLIYLESLEDTFLDEKVFPEFMIELKKLRAEAYNFEKVLPSVNAGFTFGAMYTGFFGIPMPDSLLLSGGNDGINVALGNRLSSLPSILNRAGYYQSFMRGPPVEFGSTNILLAKEKFDRIWSPPDADNPLLGWEYDKWGLFDHELFELAYEEFLRLGDLGTPFNLTLLTVNGHNPKGFCPPDAPPYRGWEKDIRLLAANQSTDRALAEFVQKLKSSSYWKDTVVILLSDHPALYCTVSETLYANPERKLIFSALNSSFKQGENHTPGRTYDVAPTVLELIGVKHNYLFPSGESLLATPDVKRFEVETPAGLAMLDAFVRYRTFAELGSSFTVVPKSKAEAKFLAAGLFEIPIYASAWGVQSWPEAGNIFVVKLDADNRIITYGLEKADFAEKNLDNAFNYLILGERNDIIPSWVAHKPGKYVLGFVGRDFRQIECADEYENLMLKIRKK